MMSTVPNAVQALKDAGVRCALTPNLRVALSPASLMSDELRALVRMQRHQVVMHLQSQIDQEAAEWRVDFDGNRSPIRVAWARAISLAHTAGQNWVDHLAECDGCCSAVDAGEPTCTAGNSIRSSFLRAQKSVDLLSAQNFQDSDERQPYRND